MTEKKPLNASRWPRRMGAIAIAMAVGMFGTATAAHAIGGGAAVADGTYPFVASIDTGVRSCSGVLVDAQWVLTVKSCFGTLPALAGPPPTPTTATVGRTNLTQSTGVQVAVVEVSAHPTLNVALAKLASRVADTAPVAIGSAPVAGEVLQAAGYGRTATAWVPDRLFGAGVTVETVTDGGFSLAGAGGAAVTTCQGDAGGPTLRVVGGQVQLVGVHDGSRQPGCLDSASTEHGATDVRVDKLDGWIRQHVAIPQPVDEMSRNLAEDATVTASSSLQDWGWQLADINDGAKDDSGWSSWPSSTTSHAEWLEFAFAGGVAHQVNRVDVYPRPDGAPADNNFPANFTIDVWNGTAWQTVVSKTNFPKPASGQRFTFPTALTNKFRVSATVVGLIQLSEVEAYYSSNLAADATVTARSSLQDWGWQLADINDSRRDENGYSSWPSSTTSHAEWLEFTFSGGVARQVNRVDLYPRPDGAPADNNFPANFTIDVWNGTAWQTVVSKTNFPKPASGQRFTFPTALTSKFRVSATVVGLIQLSEVEAYYSSNLAADATVTASSSVEDWGWFLIDANDGVRDESGWTSWPGSTEPSHEEWLELAFPGGATRQVNRVDVYPRVDVPVAENNFPANFAIDVWNGTAWQTVASKANYPSSEPARVAFPAQTTSKIRVRGIGVSTMQLNEVEAYNLYPSAAVSAPANPLPSIVEERDYPGAAAILASRGIQLGKGDGHIVLVDCGANPNSPPADIILVQTYNFDLPGGLDFCFKATGTSGYLTMVIPMVYTVRGDDSRTLAAKVRTEDETTIVDTERVDPREWQPVGVGQSRGEAAILELRFPFVAS